MGLTKIIGEKIIESAADKFVTLIIQGLCFLWAAGVGTGVISDPLYHSYWAKQNAGWFPLFFVVFLASIVLSASRWGFFVVSIFALLTSIAFGVLYERSAELRTLAWILHWILYAVAPSVLTGVVLIAIKYFRGVKPSSA